MLDCDVIVPPPNVRGLLEKAASAVGRTPALESRIAQKHASDPRFAFLRRSDPYHAYFRAKVEAARLAPSSSAVRDPQGEAKPADVAQTPAIGTDGSKPPQQAESEAQSVAPRPSDASPAEQNAAPGVQSAAPAVSRLKAAKLKSQRERPVPEKPPPDDLFSVPDVIPAPDLLSLDVMKLVAQCWMRDGREFVNLLEAKESRNPLFDFLKPMHPHFAVFQRILDAYAAIAEQRSCKGSGFMAQLCGGDLSRSKMLETFWYRHDWERCKGSENGREGVFGAGDIALAAVDWHDFVVVETVDLHDSDVNLPAPLADPSQIPRVMAAADNMRQQQVKNQQDVDMDLEVDGGDAHDQYVSKADTVVVTADVDSDIPFARVRRPDADPRSKGTHNGEKIPPTIERESNSNLAGQCVRLPDGQIVPLAEATPAMHAQLLDPKYKEERLRASAKNQRQNLADGEQVALQLARLNKTKPDAGVYNRGDLQGSLAGRAKDVLPESIKLPTPAQAGPSMPIPTADGSKEHPAKKARVEAAVGALTQAAASKYSAEAGKKPGASELKKSDLQSSVEMPDGRFPEADWLAKVGEKIAICVAVPLLDNRDWLLSGQEINLEVPVRSTVQRLKEVLAKPACTKVPPNKQKLHYEGVGFLSNHRSLAYYNIAAGGRITLEVKERGGKKKNM
jgi:splicing factor 3A subunit 1